MIGMKVDVIDLEGKSVGQVELPQVFEEPLRKDLIMRAFHATQSKKRQPYSPDYMAGKRTSAEYIGRRRVRGSMMNKEMARLPRLRGETVPWLSMRARFVPQAVGGRRAHPPLVEKVWALKINKKENRKAIRSAIAATSIKDIVSKRGHRVNGFKELPIIVENKFEDLNKTKDVLKFLIKIGLEKELERISERKMRAGKGKARSRKYKNKVGPLFVVAREEKVRKAVENISGCDVCKVENLSVEKLAPGADAGRLAIFTKDALEKL